MNERRIYACYNTTGLGGDLLEFWSINKKLYDMYVSMYYKHLTKKEGSFIHRMIPIDQYDHWVKYNRDTQLKIFDEDVPWCAIKTPMVSTESDREIFNVEDVLNDFLKFESVDPGIIRRMPRKIQAMLYKTLYPMFIGEVSKLSDHWRKYVDPVNLLTLATALRYSHDGMLEMDDFNDRDMNPRHYNRFR